MTEMDREGVWTGSPQVDFVFVCKIIPASKTVSLLCVTSHGKHFFLEYMRLITIHNHTLFKFYIISQFGMKNNAFLIHNPSHFSFIIWHFTYIHELLSAMLQHFFTSPMVADTKETQETKETLPKKQKLTTPRQFRCNCFIRSLLHCEYLKWLKQMAARLAFWVIRLVIIWPLGSIHRASDLRKHTEWEGYIDKTKQKSYPFVAKYRIMSHILGYPSKTWLMLLLSLCQELRNTWYLIHLPYISGFGGSVTRA